MIAPGKKIKIKFDQTKPNGTPRKLLSIGLSKKYGWSPKTDLKDAISQTYKDFLKKSGLQRLIFRYKTWPVIIAKVLYPIPFRTRKSSLSAPMVLCLKTWKSRTLPA